MKREIREFIGDVEAAKSALHSVIDAQNSEVVSCKNEIIF